MRALVGSGTKIRRHLLTHFRKIDFNGDANGAVSLAELQNARRIPLPSKSGTQKKTKRYAIVAPIIFPEKNMIVDVDEFFDMFQVVVMPDLSNPEVEYQYYAKTYASLPVPIPDPTTVGAEPVDSWMGIYRTGWVTETHHSDKFSDFGNGKPATRKLIVWERSRTWTNGIPGPWGPWQSESLTFHAHRANLYPEFP